MNKQLQISIIRKKIGENSDLLDLSSEIDGSLSLEENLSLLKGRINSLAGKSFSDAYSDFEGSFAETHEAKQKELKNNSRPYHSFQSLKPLMSPLKKYKLFAFDIETYGDKNLFQMGSIQGDGLSPHVFWDKSEFILFLKKNYKLFQKSYIAATNLQFDFLALCADTEIFSRFTPIIRNSKFLCVKLYLYENSKNALTFIDTLSLAPFSVEKWGEILKFSKLPHPKCLGKKNLSSIEKAELENYNVRDSEITYRAAKFLQDGFNDKNAEMKITLASTAMNLYRRNYMKGTYFQPNRKILEMSYKSYHGGRTEIIKRGRVHNLNYYDVNSLYPSVMRNKYPNPNKWKYKTRVFTDDVMQKEGFCNAKLKAPDSYIPYLPIRIEKPEKKLIFVVGRIEGWYTFFEIRKALKHNYSLIELNEGVVYEETFEPFREYVENLYSERLKYQKENNPMEIIIKLLLNSLYGKWAQKIDDKEIVIHEDQVTMEMLNYYSHNIHAGHFFIFRKTNTHIPNFINPIFSIYTTAYARDALYNLIGSGKNAYYYDTDSLMTKDELEDSKELGKFKKEFTIKDGILIKPKMYIIDEKVRCKGLGRMERPAFELLIQTQKHSMMRCSTFKESNRRNLGYNQKMNIMKHIGLEDNKRLWEGKFNKDILEDSIPLENK